MTTLKYPFVLNCLRRCLRQALPLLLLGAVLCLGWPSAASAAARPWAARWAETWTARLQNLLRPSLSSFSASPSTAFAVVQTFNVTSLADDGSMGTLRWAVTQANNTMGADTIEFQSGLTGTITLTTAQGGTLTLTDTSGATTINGPTSGGGITVSGGTAVRVFAVNDNVTANFNNLTITGGSVGHLQSGAGINSLGAVTISNCIITGNTATGETWGAGLAVSGANGSLTLLNSTVSSNSAKYGAGIYINSRPFTFVNSTISNNTGQDNAAGFYNRYGTGTIIGCTISGNRSVVTGGITNEGDMTIINSTISGNRADASNSIFRGNGGGLINQGPAMRLYNCTITGNVGIEGGGIQTQGDYHLVMKNTIVAGNVSTFGGSSPYDLRFTGSDGFNDSVLGASTYNLIGSVTNSGGLTNGVNGNIVGNNGSGTVPIANILNTTLANNGGPTLTHALADNSPALNVGSNLTTLNGAINDTTTTTITLTNAAAFPAGLGFVLQIDNEQMTVVSKTSNQLTVTRGANGTTAATHSNGAGVNPAFDQRGSGNPRIGSSTIDMGAVEKVVTTPPMIANCPMASQTVNADMGLCTAAVAFAPTATGAPTPTIVCKIGATTITSPYNFPLGTSNVTCTASNGVGSDATCSFAVTVVDAQAPTLTCPTNKTATATSAAGASVTYTVPTGSDNCGTPSVSCMPVSGTTFPLGTTTVTCTVVDAAMLSNACNFTVSVACPTITVSPNTPTLTAGTIGIPYTQSFTQSGAFSGAVVFNVSGGSLPPGLSLSPSGVLSGTPTQTGTANFTVTATNAGVCYGSQSYSLSISCPTITVSPASPLPAATAGSAYSVNFTQTGAFAGSASFSVSAGSLPPGLTLAGSTLSGTPTQTGTFNFTIKATDTYTCAGSRAYSLTVNCSTLLLAPSSLTSGQAGVVLNQALSASGGVAPYSFSLAVGSTLPAGLTLGASGLLSGTPTTSGTFSFTIKTTDANGCTGTQAYSLNILCPALSAAPAGLPNAVIGTLYSQTLTGSGGVGPYSFALRSGTFLPAGLTLTSGGLLSGTPTALGTSSFIVDVTDAGSSFGGVNCAGNRSYTLTVVCPTVTLTPATLPNGATNTAYNQTLAAAPSGTTYTFAVTSGTLPPGLSLASNGALTGTPTSASSFAFTVTATGWGGCSSSKNYSILITNSCATISLSPTTLPGGTADSAYSQTLSATPTGTYSFAVTSGALPTGLTLSSGGLLSGTPTGLGAFSFTVTATGAGGCTGTATYSLTIACPTVTFSPATLTAASAGVAYSQALTVTPTGSYIYSLQVGSLPPGLSLNPSTGLLSGLATATGTYNFTVKATGGSGCNGTKAYSLVVNCPTITINPTSLPSGSTGTAYSQTLTATPATTYSFTKLSGTLPPGLTLSTAGVLSGTPTTLGTYTFVAKATGFGACSGTRSYSVTISATCPTITLPGLANGTVGALYNGDLSGITPAGSYTLSLQSGTLPPGLALDNFFIALSGTPTTAGTYNFVLKATRTDGCSGTQAYAVVIASAGAALALWSDYNGDGVADPAQWSASTGEWRILLSGANPADVQTKVWGGAGDVSLLGDYDGDGKTDLAIFRPSQGAWYVQASRDGAVLVKNWGGAADVPVPGDYDGDGKTDIAVWRPAEGNWYILRSADQQARVVNWGSGAAQFADVPVPGDYDGDGKTDIAVFRRATGEWFIQLSRTQQTKVLAWGLGTDVPVVADYDGDGQSDIAVWRGSAGVWYVVRSSDQNWQSFNWGSAAAPFNDLTAPGDYDGDGKADVAVWRAADDTWYIQTSREASVVTKMLRATPATSALPVRARQP